MFASLASLILDAIGLLLRSVELALPAPLQQMAPTLAHTRSCRRVSVGTEAMNATVHMSRLEIVNVRRAQELDTHMVNRIVAGGLNVRMDRTAGGAGDNDGSSGADDIWSELIW